MSKTHISSRSRAHRPMLMLSLAVLALLVSCVMIIGFGRTFEQNRAFAESVPV